MSRPGLPSGLATSRSDEAVTTYTYDSLGKLLAVDLPDGATIEYTLDPDGRRVRRALIDGETTSERRWLYAGALHPVATLDENDDVLATYVYGTNPDVPDYIVVEPNDDVYRIITDHLGSVRLVVEVATGTVVQRRDYDAWGRILGEYTAAAFAALDVQPFGYAGGMYDPATGFVHFGAREYDPETRRWTGKDPIRFDGGDTSIYAYVGGCQSCENACNNSSSHSWPTTR